MPTDEQQVIGILLNDPKLVSKVKEDLKPEMFIDKNCQIAFTDILNAYLLHEPTNIYKIIENHKNEKRFVADMHFCFGEFITSVTLEKTASVIRDRYRKKKLNEAMRKANATGNIEEAIENLKMEIEGLKVDKEPEVHTLGQLVKMYRDNYFREREMILTGFKTLDAKICRLDRGDITVIGARPAVGKSAFSAQLGWNISEQGYKVGFFGLEMADSQIYERFLSMKSGIGMKRIRKGVKFLNDEEERFNKGNEEISKSNLKIITHYNKVDDIRLVTETFGFDVIIVDYLQLVRPNSTYKGNRAAEVAEVSADFKRLAMELNCHVILLSQLNRKTEEKKRPSMAEMRESGAIEQDASNILVIWNLKTSGEKGCAIEKCRQGELGEMVLKFDGEYMTFSETDKDLKEEEELEDVDEWKNPF